MRTQVLSNSDCVFCTFVSIPSSAAMKMMVISTVSRRGIPVRNIAKLYGAVQSCTELEARKTWGSFQRLRK